MTTCEKRAVLWAPWASMSGTFGIANCQLHPDDHRDGMHQGEIVEYANVDGLRPGEPTGAPLVTVVSFMDADRRAFTGDLVMCIETAGCLCPSGHRGRCAT